MSEQYNEYTSSFIYIYISVTYDLNWVLAVNGHASFKLLILITKKTQKKLKPYQFSSYGGNSCEVQVPSLVCSNICKGKHCIEGIQNIFLQESPLSSCCKWHILYHLNIFQIMFLIHNWKFNIYQNLVNIIIISSEWKDGER